jgi:hypothetical protein
MAAMSFSGTQAISPAAPGSRNRDEGWRQPPGPGCRRLRLGPGGRVP